MYALHTVDTLFGIVSQSGLFMARNRHKKFSHILFSLFGFQQFQIKLPGFIVQHPSYSIFLCMVAIYDSCHDYSVHVLVTSIYTVVMYYHKGCLCKLFTIS